MKLRNLRLRQIRHIGSLDLVLEDKSGGFSPLLITGPAGSGKTTVLEAIIAARAAVSPRCLAPARRDWAPDPAGDGAEPQDARIELDWLLDAGERALTGMETSDVTTAWRLARPGSQAVDDPRLGDLLGGFSRARSSWKMEYFHAGRSFDPDSSMTLGSDSLERTRRTAVAANKYGWVRAFLEGEARNEALASVADLRARGVVLSAAQLRATGRFAEALKRLSPRLHYLGVEERAGRQACLFARPKGQTVELGALTGSEAMAVLVAAAFEALGLERSLVLIDLPELGIHPEDQAAFFEGVSQLAPGGQIIATTTSPALLRAAPRDRVVVLGS